MVKNIQIKVMICIILLVSSIFIALAVSGCTKESKAIVAITFDTEYDYGIPGYQSEYANEQKWINAVTNLKQTAEENNVRFQFNVLGKTAEDYPELIKELSLTQDISCHTYSHKNQTELNYSEKEYEILKCKEILENITGNEIRGNRFPYTKSDNDSFELLEKYGYKWDSSKYSDSSETMVPYQSGNLTEFPLYFAIDDWEYFMNENRTNSEEFYNILYQDIINLKDKKIVYVVLLHPWVLSVDDERTAEFDDFVRKLKEKGINTKSIDEIYKDL